MFDTALFQIVFKDTLKAFSLLRHPLVTSPIGQFTVLDLLWEHGQRHADKVTSPMKLVLDNRGLNNCDICLFQNTTVCLLVLPFDVEDTVKTTLMIPFMIFEMAAIGCPS